MSFVVNCSKKGYFSQVCKSKVYENEKSSVSINSINTTVGSISSLSKTMIKLKLMGVISNFSYLQQKSSESFITPNAVKVWI